MERTWIIIGILFVLVTLVIALFVLFYSQHNIERMNSCKIPDHALYSSGGPVQTYDVPHRDYVREYDYVKTYDPLEQPVRRVPRHELHAMAVRDIPTRGMPDNFTQVGVLVRKEEKARDSDNQVIRLFGRQEYPGSNRYEYYTLLDNQIKIPVNTVRNNELYDDDIVFIKELHNKYTVHLHKYDMPRYYPFIE